MSSAAAYIGAKVEKALDTHKPARARHWLELAWKAMGLTDLGCSSKTVEQATQKFNAAIARCMTKGLAHPAQAVVVNIFFPCEFIRAFNLTPLFPEGEAVYLANTCVSAPFARAAEEYGIPETLCSYHKVMLGTAMTHVLRPVCAIAHTTLACDANQVSFRELARIMDCPRLVIDVPRKQIISPHELKTAIASVAQQLRDCARELERTSGHTLDGTKLKTELARSRDTLKLVREFVQHRAYASLNTSCTSELCLLLATHCLLGTQEAYTYAHALLQIEQELEDSTARQPRKPGFPPAQKPRIFWMHTLPNWQESMQEILDGIQGKAELVGTDLTYDTLFEALDKIEELEQCGTCDPFEEMAVRLICNAQNGSAANRIKTALRAAQAAQANGVVVFCHWGCKQTMGMSALASAEFAQANIATLVLDGDGCDPQNALDGQMRTRLEAFIESLANKEA